MTRDAIKFGDVLTCAETGKQFVAARDGCSTNYARNDAGEVFSDEGVHAREVRGMLDRTKPFTGYLSQDGRTFTGWKGNKLGDVVQFTRTRNGFYRSELVYVRVRDVHGALWFGKGAGESMCITLRAMKGNA